ncbi:HEAT repeat domain-containing protein [Ornithinimicrobium sp. W1665]|uniref:HEAT repeat domain-containing protein n=1 Tax=Ornithinimicrobium sp. W1665 TaxID=3416666 RepID=UPI003D6A3EBB
MPELAARLRAGDPVQRRHAAEVLMVVGDPDARPAVDALVHAVEHDDKEVALVAVEALARLEVPEVDEALRRLRGSADRWLAIIADWLLSDRAERRQGGPG